ncbi:MAG TPA: alpha/beta hydrolase [Acidimicrobiia bacterium]|nr:alpha/beta hydrolase [Acidimicrobiia bacterium]
MRAVEPTSSGYVERSGIRLGYEVFGDGDPTIILLPTWTIIHSRFWKMQTPYLSRHHRVITYDGPGNGRSDRTTDPERYRSEEYAHDAAAVLDACGVDRAVLVGLSLGAKYGARFAWMFPERTLGLVMIGPSLHLDIGLPEREAVFARLFEPSVEDAQGWDKYNVDYWYTDYADFTEFFFAQCFSEPHSTKPREDAVGWAGETGPDVLDAESRSPEPELGDREALAALTCPVLVIHGTGDRIAPYTAGEEAARLTDGTLAALAGSGHIPNVRDPVKVNLLLRDFVDRLAS